MEHVEITQEQDIPYKTENRRNSQGSTFVFPSTEFETVQWKCDDQTTG